MMAKWNSGKSELFLDMSSMPCVPKCVKSVNEQEKYESRRLWREVTHGLKTNNIEVIVRNEIFMISFPLF